MDYNRLTERSVCMVVAATSMDAMKELKTGDMFWVNGQMHRAVGNSHRSGDSTCDEYIVYDELGEAWFETDFWNCNNKNCPWMQISDALN